MGLTSENVGAIYQQKSKAMSSPEQNYLSLFAMRYPVVTVKSTVEFLQNFGAFSEYMNFKNFEYSWQSEQSNLALLRI
jgi:hypothetical protein